MDESLERKTLVAEIRVLSDVGMQGFLHYTDEELNKLSIDELARTVRNLRDIVRSLGGSKGQ